MDRKCRSMEAAALRACALVLLSVQLTESNSHLSWSEGYGLGMRPRSRTASIVLGHLTISRVSGCLRIHGGKRRRATGADESSSMDFDYDPLSMRQGSNPVDDLGDGPGAAMMRKMGYQGKGLGRNEQGIREPVLPGVQPAKSAAPAEPMEPVTWFSDSSDMEDRRAYGPGMEQHTKAKLDQKIRKATGTERQRKKGSFKPKRMIFRGDFNEEGDENSEFLKKWTEKYGVSTQEGDENESSETDGRTDWRSFDQVTRSKQPKKLKGPGSRSSGVRDDLQDNTSKDGVRIDDVNQGQGAKAWQEDCHAKDSKRSEGEFFDPGIPYVESEEDNDVQGGRSPRVSKSPSLSAAEAKASRIQKARAWLQALEEEEAEQRRNKMNAQSKQVEEELQEQRSELNEAGKKVGEVNDPTRHTSPVAPARPKQVPQSTARNLSGSANKQNQPVTLEQIKARLEIQQTESKEDSHRAMRDLLRKQKRNLPAVTGPEQTREEEMTTSGRHQDDPDALLKLKDKPGLGGGWREPKGGFKRWFEGQQVPDEMGDLLSMAKKRKTAISDEVGRSDLDVKTDDIAELERIQSHALGKPLQTVTDEDGMVWNVVPEEGLDLGKYDKWTRAELDKDSAKQQVAAYRIPEKGGKGGFYPDGVVLHKGWKPKAGYKPVDTSGVDSIRPHHQQVLIKLVNANIQKRMEIRDRKKADHKKSMGGDWNQSQDSAKAAKSTGKFSFTDYLSYQEAIRKHVKKQKWKRKLATGAPPAMPGRADKIY